MKKNPVNSVIWVAKKFSYSQSDLDELIEYMPSNLSPSEEVIIESEPPLIFRAHGSSLQMIVEDNIWDISFNFAEELLYPVKNEHIYSLSRLFLKENNTEYE